MTAILALVSKSGFAELERTHGTIRPGSTVPVDAYFSAHKRLEPLASGGSLWMCTVRDGALWLVAVLENPRFGKKQWKAAPNEKAVVDVSDLVGSLQFDNGKGLTAPPEKWGMSLQTPRVLSMADEALLRAKVSPSPGAAFKVAMLEATGEKGRRKGAAKTPKTGAKRSSKVTAAQALADVAQWRAASDDVRAEALASACAATGLTPLDHVRGVDGLGAAKHERSGLEFILVPGGTMVMGYAADDLHAVMGVLDDEELEELDSNLYFLDMFGVARPPRAVVVRPFFATRGRVDPKHARGFRLPSEAEWEWIAREGGAVSFVALPRDEHPLTPTMVPPVSDEENGWGFADLLNAPEPVADGWHPDYRGAPETSEPWEPGDAPAVSRSGHTWWQSYEEASALHAASRTREVEGDGQRLVVQVPEVAPKAQRVDWAARARSIFEGLCGRKAKDRTRAVGALAAQASRPGPDTVALAEQILAGFSEIHAKARAETLAHLARAVQGAEGDVAESLRKQIDGAADALMDAMADKVPAVRANAAFLLSACGKRAAKAAAERMRAELGKERRTELRAGLLLALGRLGATTGKRVPELLEAARTKEGIVRAAAVVALVELEGEGSIDDERLGWLAEATAASPSRQEFPWFDGKLGERAYALVSMAALPARERAVRAMIPALGPGRERLAASALSLVFERRELDPNELCPIPDAASLTETQRALLEALAASEGMRPIRYEDFGLPQSVLDRQVWLGVAPPLFLETEFSLPMPKRRRALEHAHGLRNAPDGKGVVHRDVSPQNILVSLHGEVKLSDFGIARVVETRPRETSPMGKARYMAPEQMAGRAGPLSDLFAAGAVLHELLEGRKFRERTPRHAMLRAALDGQVPPISRPLTPALHQLVLRLAAADPQQRLPSAHAALAFMDEHELTAEAAGEWAALSTRASASQRQLAPPGGSEHSLSGEATEHGTGETVADAAAHAPTRTRIEGRRRRWPLPVLIVVGLGVLSVPGYFGWRTWARSRMPTYTFDTGVAACDELLQALSRYEKSPGQPYHSESALRELEAIYNNGAARDPAAQQDTCIETATRMKDEGVYRDW